MKYLTTIILTALCAVYTFAQAPDSIHVPVDTLYFGGKGGDPVANAREIYIAQGTEIVLKLESSVTSQNGEIALGQVVPMVVYGNIMIDGKVAFATNMQARATVTDYSPAKAFGRPATVSIEVYAVHDINSTAHNVQGITRTQKGKSKRILSIVGVTAAVAGTVVGAPIALFCGGLGFLEKGGEVTISEGTMFRAIVAEDIRIKG